MDLNNKFKINENNKYFQFSAYLLALVSILQVAKATIFEKNNFDFIDINPWAFTELFINYEGGFVRRGFIGNIIINLDNDGILFDTLYSVVFFNFLFLVILILINLEKSKLNNFQKFLYNICIFGPFNVTLFGYFFARKEIFIINLYLIILIFFRQANKRIFLFSCYFFGSLAILIHEGIAFFILYPFILYLMKIKNISGKLITTFTSMMVVLFLIIIFFKGDNQISAEIWSSLSKEDTFLIETTGLSAERSAIGAIGWGVLQTLQTTYVMVFSGSLIYWGVFFAMVIYTVSQIFNESFSKIFLMIKNITLSNKEFLIILPLFIIGFDWGRWIFTIFNFIFFTLILSYEKITTNLKISFNLVFFFIISLLTSMPPCCIAMEGTKVTSNYYRIFKSIELTILQFLN